MLNKIFKRIAMMFLLTALAAGLAHAQGTAFTYQGRLTDGGNPADGMYDMQFKLFDVNNIQQGQTISFSSVQATNGVFKVDLDFGSATFDGTRRYLEIGVRPENSSDPHTVLSPRQLVTAAPYSIRSIVASTADTANTANTATNSAQLGGLAASQYVLTTDSRMTDARPPAAGSNNYLQNQGVIQQTPASFNISGSGTLGGTLTANAISANTINGNGSGLTSLNASNISSGTLDTARLGIVPAVKGGTGLISAGAIGNYLRSTGTGWTSSALLGSDIPDGSAFYVQNQTTQQAATNFNISGNGTVSGQLKGGTINATSAFHINGVRALSAIDFGGHYAGNLYIGFGAGQNTTPGPFNTSDGKANTFVGSDAGFSNMTGYSNSFFGGFAGRDTQTGNSNSFFGWSAGVSNTTGSNNSFFGSAAGYESKANDNSFFGSQAGELNTIGSSNSIFGVRAGRFNSTANGNSFFGWEAGHRNNASGNSFFGMSAGASNYSGVGNSFFGQFAGELNRNGHSNAFFGSSAGLSTEGDGDASFASGNAFFGVLAGHTNRTGSNNTAIGYNADVIRTDLTNATAIGANARVFESNSLVLGNGANVGIGTNAPKSKLHVQGGNIYIAQPNSMIITSPNGACWFITVNNSGALSTISVTCP
jgi:hypothetical protein